MSWIMKWLHLIFVVLALCGDTSGFTVRHRIPVVDWQAGHSNTSWSQNNRLSTPVQPSKLLAGRGENVRGGGFGDVPLTSEVQPALHGPSFVQSSGAAAPDASVLYTQRQGGPTIQQHELTAGPSRLYQFDPFHAENKRPLVSQSQSAANTNLMYGSQTQSSKPSIANQVITGQFVPGSLGASYLSQTSGRHPIFQGQMEASPFRVSGFQTQSPHQPGTSMQVSAGQSVSGSRTQSSGASMLYDGLTSGRYLTSMGKNFPSSTQTASSYQPSSATQVLTGQSASKPVVQASGVSMLNQGLSSGRYLTALSKTIPFPQSAVPSRPMSSFQTSSYDPSTTTWALTGQSASTPLLQSSDASTAYELQASTGRQSIPSSSQSLVSPNQMYGSQTQFPYQPSSPIQISTGQFPISQAPSRSESSENAKWYTVMHPQTVSASFPPVGTANQLSGFQTLYLNQPSSTSQVLAGQSTIAEPLVASDSYQSQTSGGSKILQGHRRQPQMPGSQAQSPHQPSTTACFSANQPTSTSQALSSGASMLKQGLTPSRYQTSLAQSFPFSSQSVATSNQEYGSQISPYQPFASFLPGYASIAAAPSMDGSQKVLPSLTI